MHVQVIAGLHTVNGGMNLMSKTLITVQMADETAVNAGQRTAKSTPLKEWVKRAIASGRVYLDTETFYHVDRPNNPELWGYCYAIGFGADDDSLSVYLWHELNDPNHLNRADVAKLLRYLVERVAIVFHNSLFDLKIIENNFGIKHADYLGVDDSMLAMGLYFSELPKALDFCSSIMGSQNKHKQLATQSSEYLVGDIVATRDCERELRSLLAQDTATKWVYDNIQRPLIPIVHDAHMRGIRIDQDEVASQAKRLTRQRDEASATAQAYCGYAINLNSTGEVSDWLFNFEKIEPIAGDKPGKSGAYSLKKDKLAIYQDSFAIRDHDLDETLDQRIAVGGHPLIEAKASHAQVAGLLTNFVNKCARRERIYPNFKIHQQATGRWSSVDPPISGMPASLKTMLIPDPGHVHVSGDSANIELRLIAYIAGDQLLIDAFNLGYDLHSVHSAQAFGWDTLAGRLEWIGRSPAMLSEFVKSLDDDVLGRLIYQVGYYSDADYNCEHYKHVVNLSETDPGAGRGWGWAQWKTTKMPGAQCDRCWLSWALHGGPPPDWQADDDLRRRFAKAFVFRLLFGGSPKRAHTIPGANQLGLPTARINAASQRWADTHTALIKYWNDVHDLAVNTRCVRTVFGRPRRLLNPDIEKMKRAASNHPVQGSSADYLNFSVLEIAQAAPWSYLAMTCHDSIKHGCELRYASDLYRISKECAERPRDINGTMVSIPWEPEPIKVGREAFGYDLLFVEGQEHLLKRYAHLPMHETPQGTLVHYEDFHS